MTSTIATGFGRAVGVFNMSPEFPVEETRARLGVQSPIEAGMWQRRQTMLSCNEVDFNDQVREWRLRWNIATKEEAENLRTFYAQSRGSARLLLYYPMTETLPSNLCPSGEKFDSTVWLPTTDDTAVVEDATTPPSGVTGSAYLMTNASGASLQANLTAHAFTYPTRPQLIAWSVHIQRPGSNPASYMSLRMRDPLGGNVQYVTIAWNGAAWASESASIGTTAVLATSGAWTRVTLLTFSEIPGIPSFPTRRYLDIEVGKSSAVEAGKGLLIAGGMLQEVPSIQDASDTYTAKRRHALVRIVDAPLRIERHGPVLYRMQVTLREVPVAP